MMYNHTSWLKTSQGSSVCMHASPHLHAIHDERLIVSRCFSVPRFDPLRVSLSFTLLFSSHFYLYFALNSFFQVDNAKANIPCVSANWGVSHLGRIHSSHSNKRGVRRCMWTWNWEPSWRSDVETGCLQNSSRETPMPVNQTTREVQKLKE